MRPRETKRLKAIYRTLLRHFGPQNWWPAKTPFEVCVGAILTQNTSWENVSRAIGNIRAAGKLELETLRALPDERLSELIRPSGYFRLKSRRLKCLLDFLAATGGGDWRGWLRRGSIHRAREALLGVHGVGPETADSILLYAADRPSFVVDKYTLRFGARYGLFPPGTDYAGAWNYFMDRLPRNAPLYNEYHALIVRLGAEVCRSKPLCPMCPLVTECIHGKGSVKAG